MTPAGRQDGKASGASVRAGALVPALGYGSAMLGAGSKAPFGAAPQARQGSGRGWVQRVSAGQVIALQGRAGRVRRARAWLGAVIARLGAVCVARSGWAGSVRRGVAVTARRVGCGSAGLSTVRLGEARPVLAGAVRPVWSRSGPEGQGRVSYRQSRHGLSGGAGCGWARVVPAGLGEAAEVGLGAARAGGAGCCWSRLGTAGVARRCPAWQGLVRRVGSWQSCQGIDGSARRSVARMAGAARVMGVASQGGAVTARRGEARFGKAGPRRGASVLPEAPQGGALCGGAGESRLRWSRRAMARHVRHGKTWLRTVRLSRQVSQGGARLVEAGHRLGLVPRLGVASPGRHVRSRPGSAAPARQGSPGPGTAMAWQGRRGGVGSGTEWPGVVKRGLAGPGPAWPGRLAQARPGPARHFKARCGRRGSARQGVAEPGPVGFGLARQPRPGMVWRVEAWRGQGKAQQAVNPGIHEDAMNEVTMKKSELKAILEENREHHRELYEEAHDAFREKLIANLESRLDAARDGGQVRLDLNLIEPQDHTEDYDQALSMLSYEVADEVTLQQHEFAQLVEDSWGWMPQFATAYSSNTGAALTSR